MPVIRDVTVVICTRNGRSRGFLDEALKSVLEQTAPPAEVLLVDDGSTDGTAADVQRRYPEVKVLANTGSRLAAARNTGIRAARNPWISFMDDDDVWCPDKLAAQMAQAAAFAQPESTIWVARVAAIGESSGLPAPIPVPLHFASWPACLLGCPVIAPSGVLLSRELLLRIGPFDEHLSICAAYEYWIRCLAAGATVRYSETILLHYRRHRAQMTDPSRLVDLGLSADSMLLPYLEKLLPALAGRIKLARKLTWFRTLAVRSGFKSAARYWAGTPLQPGRPGLRTCTYFLLDSVASRAPQAAKRLLRSMAVRLLLGHSDEQFPCHPHRDCHGG